MEKIKRTTLLLLLFLIVFACKGEKNAASADQVPEPITLKVFSLNWQAGKTMTQDLADIYMQQNPSINVVVEELPWDPYFQNVEIRLKSSNPDMDVVIVDIPMLASYAARGLLAPLDPYISGDEIKEALVPAAVDAAQFNGKFYGATIQNSAQFLYINKSVAGKAGVTLPEYAASKDTDVSNDFIKNWGSIENRWTWTQVIEAGKKMEAVSNASLHFHMEQAAQLYQMQPLGGSLGGRIVDTTGYEVKGYLDQDPWVKALDTYKSFFDSGLETSDVFESPFTWGNRFSNGDIDMLLGGEWNLQNIELDDYAVLPHPYAAGGKATTPTGSWVASISMKSQLQKEASDFIRFLTLDDKGTEAWFDILGQLPAQKNLLDRIANDDSYNKFPTNIYRLGAYESLNTAEARPVSPFYPIIADGFNEIFRDVALGGASKETLEKGVAKIQDQIDRLR